MSAGKRKLLLKNFQSPGDIVMLTAAVRDLHKCYPDRFITDVRSSCPELWENNPYVSPLDEDDPEVVVIECHYPLIHRSNRLPYHFVQGFSEFLNQKLNLDIRPTAFRGDIHLSEAEKAIGPPLLQERGSLDGYWVIVAGGKSDFTIKIWDWERYQAVVDHFRGWLTFVQVGEEGHIHPELKNVIDLRGQTTTRELIRLIYYADGVLCPVTFAMHLAAAVEKRHRRGYGRSCVVVAGGREPPHWEAYPDHRFLHTVGSLPCCEQGGCWRSRTFPLGDGDKKDRPKQLCRDVVGSLPRCMDMIGVADVVRAIESYYVGGVLPLARHSADQESREPRTMGVSGGP